MTLAGCGHPWPLPATGGLVERDGPVEPDHIDTATTILIETGRKRISPARLATAEDHLILAIRENAAGLYEDADEDTMAASIAIGGLSQARQDDETACIGDTCPETARDIK